MSSFLEKDEGSHSKTAAGGYEKSPAKIAKHYMSFPFSDNMKAGWFWPDVVTVIPWETFAPSEVETEELLQLKVVRFGKAPTTDDVRPTTGVPEIKRPLRLPRFTAPRNPTKLPGDVLKESGGGLEAERPSSRRS